MNNIKLMSSNGDAALHGKTIPECILDEKMNQIVKFGMQEHHDFKWLSILTEEVGEVALNINEMNPAHEQPQIKINAAAMMLEHELIQVAAVCVAWIECIRHRALLAAQAQQDQTDQQQPGDNKAMLCNAPPQPTQQKRFHFSM